MEAPRRTLILVDCEAIGGKRFANFVTEVCINIVRFDEKQYQYVTIEQYHTLVKIPVKYHKDIRNNNECRYVYRHLTGLSLQTLQDSGKSFAVMKQEVDALFEKYTKNEKARIYARDPRL